jgi:hypothetical protein
MSSVSVIIIISISIMNGTKHFLYLDQTNIGKFPARGSEGMFGKTPDI